MEVLVVGAGPTGLTTAIELARQGVHTSIIDQYPGKSTLARAVGITPASLELLAPSGATEKLLLQGLKLDSIRIQTDSMLLPIEFSQSKSNSQYKYILALPQDQTETILSDILAQFGVGIRYNTALTSIKDTHDGALVTCDDGTTELYRYVVGADGAHSTTREASGLNFTGVDLEEVWSIADIETTNWHHKTAFSLTICNNGSMSVIVPLSNSATENTRIRVIANTRDALQIAPQDLNITQIHRQGTFNIAVKQLNTYQRGNIFLAGDASHCHSPVGGRGMNLGIADAVCLAHCIASDNTTAYSVERHPVGARTIANSERARKFLSTRQPLMRKVLHSSLKLTSKSAALQSRLVDQFLYA